MWNLKTGSVVREIAAFPESERLTILNMVLDEEAGIVYASAYDNEGNKDTCTIRGFDIRKGSQVVEYVGGERAADPDSDDDEDEEPRMLFGMGMFAVSKDHVLGKCDDGRLYLYARDTGDVVHVWDETVHNSSIDGLGFLNESVVYTVVRDPDDDWRVRFFSLDDQESYQIIGIINDRPGLVTKEVDQLVFCGEDDAFALVTRGHEIHLWNWRESRLLAIIPLPSSLPGIRRYSYIEEFWVDTETYIAYVACAQFAIALDLRPELVEADYTHVTNETPLDSLRIADKSAVWVHTVILEGMREYTDEEEWETIVAIPYPLEDGDGVDYALGCFASGVTSPRLIHPRTGEKIMDYVSSIGLPIHALVVDSEARVMYAGGMERDVIAYGMRGSFPELRRYVLDSAVDSLFVRPDLGIVVAGSSGEGVDLVRVWDIDAPDVVRAEINNDAVDGDLYFSDEYAVSGAGDLFLIGASGVYRFASTGVNEMVTHYAFSDPEFVAPLIPDTHPNRLVAIGESKVLVFDVETGEKLAKIGIGAPKPSAGFWKGHSISAAAAVKGYLFVAGRHLTLHALDASLRTIREIKVPGRAEIRDFVVHAATDRVYVTGKRDYRPIYAYRISTGSLIRVYRGPKDVDKLMIEDDGRTLIARDLNSNAIYVWNTDNESPVAEFDDYHEGVTALAYDHGTLYGASTYIGFRSVTQWRRFGVVSNGKCREESRVTRVSDRYGACLSFISAVFFMIISFLQLLGFAFSAAITWPKEYDSVKRATQALLSLGATSLFDSFEARFIVATAIGVLFLVAFHFQETFERAKFMRPSSNVFQMAWVAFEFGMGLLASTAFLPMFSIFAGTFDCVDDPSDSSLRVADGSLDNPNQPGSIECWTGSHIPMAMTAALLGLYFFIIALRFWRVGGELSAIEVTLNPFNWRDDALSVFEHAHPLESSREGYIFGMALLIIKALLTLALVLFTTRGWFLSIFNIICGLILSILTLLFPPFDVPAVNGLQFGLDLSLVWAFICGLLALILGRSLAMFILPPLVFIIFNVGQVLVWWWQNKRRKDPMPMDEETPDTGTSSVSTFYPSSASSDYLPGPAPEKRQPPPGYVPEDGDASSIQDGSDATDDSDDDSWGLGGGDDDVGGVEKDGSDSGDLDLDLGDLDLGTEEGGGAIALDLDLGTDDSSDW